MTDMIQIDSVEAALEHASGLDQAASLTLEELGQDPLAPGASALFLERAFEEPETLLLIAEEDGKQVGICLTGAWEEPLSGERRAAILALHVDPDMRHRGVARKLVAHAVETLRSRGVDRLGARVEHNDDVRISMGERWGWTRAWEWMDSGPAG